jgi:hypothetical protein
MRSRFFAVVASIVVASVSLARAQYPIDPGAYKCQVAVSKGFGKYAGAREKCVQKCRKTAVQLGLPLSACAYPTGGTGDPAYECVFNPIKGTLAKLAASIVKACTKDSSDCPACYAGGDCSAYATSAVSSAETWYDYGQGAVFCAALPTESEFKCMTANAKALGKLEAAVHKCYAKCVAGQQASKVPASACFPPVPADPATAACLTKAQAKAAALVDKACFTFPVAAPGCYDGGSVSGIPTFTSGAGWAGHRATVAGVFRAFCGP